MDHAGLAERLARVLGAHAPTWEGGFDPENETHVDEAARALLERFRHEDDVEAFTLLYELTHPRLVESAARIVRRLDPTVSPEELAAAFMARLFTDVRRRVGEPVRRFLALAHTAMRNDLFDQLRQQRRAANNLRDLHAAQPTPRDPAELILTAEQDRLMRRFGRTVLSVTSECFHELEPRDQQVLLAREIVGLPYDRVAALLDLAGEQVGMIIRRARVHLAGRIVERLGRMAAPADPAEAARLAELGEIVRRCLDVREAPRHVPGLVQRMLDNSVEAARRKLADLVYEMAKSCLVAAPGFSSRTLIRAEPRPGDVVAEEVRRIETRLAARAAEDNLAADGGARVPDAPGNPATALDDARACLSRLADIEGQSGRQQVALALCSIHAGCPEEAEPRLVALLARDDLPPVTRQNAARNLTLSLLRQDRHADALRSALDAADEWPDDQVRVMNVCYASARLSEREVFTRHARLACALYRSEPTARVAGWIDEPLRELAAAVGLGEAFVDEALRGEGLEPVTLRALAATATPVAVQADGAAPPQHPAAPADASVVTRRVRRSSKPAKGISHPSADPAQQAGPGSSQSRDDGASAGTEN